MSKTINSDLIRGNINTIILKSLYEGDRYGYDIIKEIEEKSHGQYILKQPTLYSCLKRLENQGFITAYWGEQTNGGRRKYYTLTDMGREVFVQYQDEYEFSRTIIDQLISEKDYDLSTIEHKQSSDDNITEEDTGIDAESDIEIEQKSNVKFDDEVVAIENEVEKEIEPDSENKKQDPVEHPTLNDEPLSVNTTSLFEEILFNENNENYSSNASNKPNESQVRIHEDNFIPYNQPYYPQEQYSANEETATTLELDEEKVNNEILSSIIESDTISPNDNTSNKESLQQADFTAYNVTPQPQPKSNPFYKSVLSELIEDFSNPTDTKPAQDKLSKDEIIAESNLSVKERIQVRNFGKLTQSIRELGENAKIRTPDTKSAREYNKQYYYYRNKLRLFQYGIVFLVMLIECFLSYVIIKRGANIHTNSDTAIYVCSILFSLAFPISAGIIYLLEPFARKRIDFNFKTSILFRIVVMVQLVVIIYAVNVYFGMPIGFSREYTLPVILPTILTTNIPLCGIIHRLLYKSKIFAVEN